MLTRRGFLGGTIATVGGLACGPRRGPTILSKTPAITHGVQSGDPSTDAAGTRALIWARCDEPARMLVEWDTTDRFADPHRVAGDVVAPDRDHCGTLALAGLPAGQTVFYRVKFAREAARGESGWTTGRLRTPRADHLRVAWTGDTCGQGFGRNPEFGGLRGYAAIANTDPDVFVHSGDLIYADNPILAEQKTPDGRIWKNITNERVARVAQELDDFRARFAYNLDDEHVRALAAQVPMIAQWDDHETHNNWFPGQQLADDRYTKLRDASQLSAMARRAMLEWVPVPAGPVQRVIHHGPLLDIFVLDCRTFRSPNTKNVDGEAMLGPDQVKWFIDAVRRSTARWKLVACDQPIGLAIDDGPNWEGWANNDPGPPSGRESELARVLGGLAGISDVVDAKPARVKNTLWITADVHYTAAHHFDPARGKGVDFEPFWELVAGPIHAGNFGPNPLDPTFGPEVKFQWAPPADKQNLPPWDGMQSFGTLDVTREALTVTLRDIDGGKKFEVTLPYAG